MFRRMLEYNGKRRGTPFVAVDPAGTTKACSVCDAAIDKLLWVREYSCPAWGFEVDRYWNAVVKLHLVGSQKPSASGDVNRTTGPMS